MRVLIAVHHYPPTYSSGAERRAERTARGLAERGHEVRVLCVESIAPERRCVTWEDSVQDGIPVRRLTLGVHGANHAFQTSYDNPGICRALAELIADWQPSLLHLFSGYLISASAVRVAVERAIPVVVSLTDYWWLCHRITLLRTDGTRCDGPSADGCARCHAEQWRRFRLPARVWPAAARAFWELSGRHAWLGDRVGLPAQRARADVLLRTLRKADVLIAPSQYLADVYIRHGIDPARVRVWRQGVAVDRCPLRTASTVLRVGYIGQIKPHKGVHLLLEAWSQLRGDHPRHLSLYGAATGEPAYGRMLQEQLARLDDATWTGAFHGAEVWSVLANLDILVVPSIWVENSPNSILEAQAMGVPVIGSNLGGVAELIQHGRNGLLFEPGDAAGLAAQLQRLLDQPGLVDQLRRSMLPFRTLDDEIDQIDALYHTLVAAPRGRAADDQPRALDHLAV